jgi:hypothetical protein
MHRHTNLPQEVERRAKTIHRTTLPKTIKHRRAHHWHWKQIHPGVVQKANYHRHFLIPLESE